MADWADVRRIALSLPEVVEDGSAHPAFRVKDKTFVCGRVRQGR